VNKAALARCPIPSRRCFGVHYGSTHAHMEVWSWMLCLLSATGFELFGMMTRGDSGLSKRIAKGLEVL
jgi:hypothetical protein